MNQVKRRIPNYCEHGPEDLAEVDFDTLDELLEIEWIKRWKRGKLGDKLLRFSLSRDICVVVKWPYELMVELNDGSFWVIGRVKEDISELPTWDYDVCEARKEAYAKHDSRHRR